MAGPKRIRLGGYAALAAAVLIAGCGSSSSSTTSKAAAASAPASSAPSTSAKGVTVATKKGSDGTYLVRPTGRALYLWMADASGRSNCEGECAKAWPPLLTTGAPVASGSAASAELGTITRS